MPPPGIPVGTDTHDGRLLSDEDTAPGLPIHQALGLQDADRLPNGLARRSVLLDQFAGGR